MDGLAASSENTTMLPVDDDLADQLFAYSLQKMVSVRECLREAILDWLRTSAASRLEKREREDEEFEIGTNVVPILLVNDADHTSLAALTPAAAGHV